MKSVFLKGSHNPQTHSQNMNQADWQFQNQLLSIEGVQKNFHFLKVLFIITASQMHPFLEEYLYEFVVNFKCLSPKIVMFIFHLGCITKLLFSSNSNAI